MAWFWSWHRRATLIAGCCILGWLVGHVGIPPAPADDATPRSAAGAAQPGVLLLNTGQIVSGRILKTGEDYTVHLPNGDMFVPGARVTMQCENLNEVYRKLRDKAQDKGSANARVTLARWCLTNHLEAEARLELNEALALEPGRTDAQAMLRSLDEAQKPPAAEPRKKSREESSRSLKSAGFAPQDVESLGGLSRESAQHFTRKIQPILMNNCTLAGCHGPDSQTGLRLHRVTAGSDTSRTAASRNLTEILARIDSHDPKKSPLLVESRGAHGRRGKPVFAGPRGAEQLKELKNWVVAVGKETAAREKRASGESPAEKPKIVQTQALSGIQKDPFGTARSADEDTGDKQDSPAARTKGKRKESSSEWRASDPFDPAIFNRKSGKPADRQ